jgi:two-component system phosphate regulon sensor histidine kinase PhoR
MSRCRFFWKLFLPFAALHLVAVVILVLVSTGPRGAGTLRLWLTGSLASGGVLLVTWWLTRRLARRVTGLTSVAEAIAGGDYSQVPDVSPNDELGRLAEALERMQREVRGRLAESRETAQRLNTVLGGMDQGIIAIGANRTVLLANTAARQMLELTLPSVQGASLSDVLPDPQLRKTALEVLRRPGSQRLILERNGTTQRVLGVQATPMPGDPCPGVVLVLHDETELRRLESLRQDFVANVSHELKTPLSSIKAYAETLAQGAINDPENNLRFVARIEEQADRLHQLILDLLRLARIESGEQTFDIGAVSVADVVGACLADHRDAAEAKSIQVNCEQADLAILARADEEGLRQILDNLVDNAIKYTSNGGTVTVRVSRERRSVHLEVQDTGIGIPPQLQPRVFERFFRVDKARSRELGGTGLGLSIVKHLAQSFGGSVSVQSERGKGSTFTVELPAVS